MNELKARNPRTASAAEILHLAGSLVFLLYGCFDKIARGGLRPFYDWLADNVDSATLWRTKDGRLSLSSQLLGGMEFVLRALPLLKPRVYHLNKVASPPLVAYSDAEWSPPAHPPLTLTRVWEVAFSWTETSRDVPWKHQSTSVTHWHPAKHKSFRWSFWPRPESSTLSPQTWQGGTLSCLSATKACAAP